MTTFPLLAELRYWINERENIRVRKECGDPKPWTRDPILQSYRFCNVRREDDKVTRWVKKHWRDQYPTHENLPFAMLVARLINLPEALNQLGFPWDWSGERFVGTLHTRQALGGKNFNSAYIVSTNGVAMDKVEYLEKYVLTPAYPHIRSTPRRSLREAYAFLTELNGIGSFIAGQIIADLKHTPYLCDALDWNHWCAKGPGSQRGLNRLMKQDIEKKWNNDHFIDTLSSLRKELELDPAFPLCLQDLQNCLCEFDKYMRAKEGGRPKQQYPGR